MALTFTISAAISSSSVASPSVITCSMNHGIIAGTTPTVTITGHSGSTPDINGSHVATRTGASTFTIPVNVTVGGTGGKVIVAKGVQVDGFDVSMTYNRADSATAKILSTDASYRPTKGQEFIVYEDATAVFGGLINNRTEQQRPNKFAGTDIISVIQAVSFKDYLRGVIINEEIAAGRTLKQILTDNIIPYLSSRGVTLHGSQADGPTFDEGFVWVGIKGSDAVKQLMEASGYDFDIDATKVARATVPSANSAPYNVTDATKKHVGDLTVEESEQEYADRVVFKGNGLVKTDTFTGDGAETTFTLTHQAVGPLNLRGYITNGGVYETLGTGATWEYDISTNSVTRTSAPTNLNSIVVVYDVLYVIAEDTAAQAARGYVTEKIVGDGTFTDVSLAELAAERELDKATGEARTIRFMTRSAGNIRPGQSLTINIANRNFNETCTVTDVRLSAKSPQIVERSITCVEGGETMPTVQRQVLRSWLGGSSSQSTPAPSNPEGGQGARCGWDAHSDSFAFKDGADAKVMVRDVDTGASWGVWNKDAALSVVSKDATNMLAAAFAMSGKETNALTIFMDASGSCYLEHDGTGGAVGFNIVAYNDVLSLTGAGMTSLPGDPASGLNELRGLNFMYGTAVAVTRVTATTHTISSSDSESNVRTMYLYDTTNNCTVSLPALADAAVTGGAVNRARVFLMKNASTTYNVTLDPDSAETIDGASTLVLAPGEGRLVMGKGSTGAGWFTIGGGGTAGAHATNHESGGSDPIQLDDLAAPSDNTDLDVSTSLHGLTPKITGSDGYVLTKSGAASVWASPGALTVNGLLIGIQTITATGSGTYTPTAGTASIVIELQGAGGGGGGCASPGGTNVSFGRGGGGGGYIRHRLTTAFSGASYSVGAKGTGGTAGNNAGNAGGDTTFTATGGGGTVYTAGGGAGGNGGASAAAPLLSGAVTAGGTTTNGTIQRPGDTSLIAFAFVVAQCASGGGGSSPYGAGGAQISAGGTDSSAAGAASTGKGSGGSGGAASGSGAAVAGGNGSDGLIVIWEYN